MRRFAEDTWYKIVGLLAIISPWGILTWPIMVFIGNLHHAGFPIKPLGYGEVFWFWSPLYLSLLVLGLILNGVRR